MVFVENVRAIKIYDPALQVGSNDCSVNNGGCQHLCLSTVGNKKTCKCSTGYTPHPTDPTQCTGR